MSNIFMEGDTLILEYNLLDLPSAQHKAGLAGLVVMMESLKLRKKAPLPDMVVEAIEVKFSFSKESFQTLMDDLYDARWIEVTVKQKWPKQKPKRIEEKEIEKDGKKKKEKQYIYDAVQPKGAFLQTFFADDDGIWVKLWRDMLWRILRGIPATRNIYEERANGKTSSEASKMWKDLIKSARERKNGKQKTASLTSSLFIGAEAGNPEKIPFTGLVEDNFLLHFWFIVTLIHIPREIKIEKKEEQIRVNRNNEVGYTLSVPEPSNIEYFCEDVINVLKSLETDKSGFRPKAARIDIFEEGGLECLYHFAKNKIDESDDYAINLHAIEIYHVQKQGNRIRQLAVEKLQPKPAIIKDYGKIRDSVKNPLYKKIYLRNLINGLFWHENADKILLTEPAPLYVFSEKSPKGVRFFGRDVQAKFNAINKNLKLTGGHSMGTNDHDDQLARRVYRLIQNYVRRKTEEKCGKKYEDFKNNKNEKGAVIYPREYREALEKVCMDAFLAMRGRREQDFIEYFTGTICSVPQFLPENEFLSVAGDLMEKWQRIKNLSMLAISANSYLSETATQ